MPAHDAHAAPSNRIASPASSQPSTSSSSSLREQQLQRQHDQQVDRSHQLEQKVLALEQQLATEKQQRRELDLFVRETNQELQRITSHALQWEQQAKAWHDQLDEKKHQMELLSTKAATLESSLHERDNQLKDHQRQLDLAQDRHTLALEQLEQDLTIQKQQLSQQQQDHRQELEQHALERQQLETKIEALKQLKLTAPPRPSSSQSQPHADSQWQAKLDNKTRQCSELQQMVRRLEALVSELRRQLDDNLAHLNDREQKLQAFLSDQQHEPSIF
ncbi:hypothetical protein DM01DRAFT_1337733 [Hesseltinella vesiculosa]|uniref:Uncharacterized protein n=1 Tax=Hesseltinella vesiculosa TaxID=101127 RepID=A0A1X2GCH6_9FUNG|nr:hypothetical protein DM01DRAFT_1337733 [Hesseltinella vesiculosa]